MYEKQVEGSSLLFNLPEIEVPSPNFQLADELRLELSV